MYLYYCVCGSFDGIWRRCPGPGPETWQFSFSTFACERVCPNIAEIKSLYSHKSHLATPTMCGHCVISYAIISPSLQFSASTNQSLPGAAFPRLRPSVSPRLCWFSLHTIYHSIRSDGAINQTMNPPSWETSLKDWLGGNAAYPGVVPDRGWEQEPCKERFSWTKTLCRC